MPAPRLPFEKPIVALEEQVAEAEARAPGSDDVRRLRRDLAALRREVYGNLSAWETVLMSRHPERPQTLDFVDLICDEFVELHGDRAIGERPGDPNWLGSAGRFSDRPYRSPKRPDAQGTQ